MEYEFVYEDENYDDEYGDEYDEEGEYQEVSEEELQYEEEERYVAGRGAYERTQRGIGLEAFAGGMDIKSVPERQRRLQQARTIIVSSVYEHIHENAKLRAFDIVKGLTDRQLYNIHLPTLVYAIITMGNPISKKLPHDVLLTDVIRYNRFLTGT